MKTFERLYKKTSTGAVQIWEVEVSGKTYRTRFGQKGGVIQVSEPTVCVGKQGRTDEQQAEFEAEALWTKKLKKDYVKTEAEAKSGGSSELIEGGILPMLAHKFSEHGDKLVYPCFVQPKLDGHRCIAKDGLWSRTRKRITGVPHIYEAYCNVTDNGTPWDGELYNHAYRNKFEQLTHFIRQSKPEAGSEVVQYHVYDAPGPGTFRQRLEYLRLVRKSSRAFRDKDGPLVLVETREVANEDELMLAFEDFLAQGYEGAIARNAGGLYVSKRSCDLLKIKKFDDAEFKCISVEEGVGKMAGHGIFVCLTKDGTEFRAKMKGSHDELVQFVDNPKRVVGKMVTVKYQGLTNKNGVPRFPVALRIREDV